VRQDLADEVKRAAQVDVDDKIDGVDGEGVEVAVEDLDLLVGTQ
jgi:hypothetical protein